MTVKELRELTKDYPDDQFVHIRLWLEPDKDYLDYRLLQATVSKVQQGVDGALLITGSMEKS